MLRALPVLSAKGAVFWGLGDVCPVRILPQKLYLIIFNYQKDLFWRLLMPVSFENWFLTFKNRLNPFLLEK